MSDFGASLHVGRGDRLSSGTHCAISKGGVHPHVAHMCCFGAGYEQGLVRHAPLSGTFLKSNIHRWDRLLNLAFHIGVLLSVDMDVDVDVSLSQ